MPEKKASEVIPNKLLKQVRLERGWSQQEVADRIGTNVQNVSRWERGSVKPEPYAQQKLSELFGKSPKELGWVPEQTSAVYDPAIPSQPAGMRGLIGRDSLLKQLKKRLLSGKSLALSALNGLPGVGKTALAVTLAQDPKIRAHFQDGILWAGLGPEPNIIGLLSSWGVLLGISQASMEKLSDPEAWTTALRAIIGPRHMLLVIDDAWTLEEALVLKAGGPNCVYLLTTRFPPIAVSFAGEGAMVVPELREEDGVALLKHFAPQIVRQDSHTALSLVRSVGGLPLALTLMGGYLRRQAYSGQERRIESAVKHVQDVQQRLRLSEPISPADRPPNLPVGTPLSLKAAIAASDQRLDEHARGALYALSVFLAKPNSFSEEAALAVSQSSVVTLDTLLDAGLLETSAPGRYTLHQTIRDYAETMRTDTTALKHLAEYFASYVEQYVTNYAMLEKESRNILTALNATFALGQRAKFVQIVYAFAPFLHRRGLYAQAELLLQQANETARELGDKLVKVNILMYLGQTEEKLGNYMQAEAYLSEGLVLTRQIGDRKRSCAILRALGMVTVLYRGYTVAETYYQEGLILARYIRDPREISGFLNNLGTLTEALGNYTQAEIYLQEALTLARQIGIQEWIVDILLNLGDLASRRVYSAQAAETSYQEGLSLARQLGHLLGTSALLNSLGRAATERGDYDRAERYLHEGLTLARQIEHPEQIGYLLGALGMLETRRGNYALAKAYLQQGLATARKLGHLELICGILLRWGEVYLEQRQLEEAQSAFHEMSNLVPNGNQELAAQAQYGMARVAAAQGHSAEAHRLGEASLAIFAAIEHHTAAEVNQWLSALL
jgi:tetratricopeptide (TPR) repeat protein/transcriptional regulator with XRE-family HTH domain